MMHGQFSQVVAIIPSRRLIIVRLGETHSDVAAARLDRAFAEIRDAGAPRAAKSTSMSPPLPPAAETWAKTVVLSML